jgi:pyruvate kinase
VVSQISENSVEPIVDLSSPQGLLSTLQELRQSVDSEGQATFDRWRSHLQRPKFLSSALNLAQYLALRRHDLRLLQAALMPWGLSSLGRIEARVMPNLDAVIATLAVICGDESAQHLVREASPLGNRPPIESFFEGDSRSERLRQRLLQQHTEALFGRRSPQRRVRIMVTLPTEAATDYDLVRETIRRGANRTTSTRVERTGISSSNCRQD